MVDNTKERYPKRPVSSNQIILHYSSFVYMCTDEYTCSVYVDPENINVHVFNIVPECSTVK